MNVKKTFFEYMVTCMGAAIFTAACAPQTAAAPTMDIIGTTAAQLASQMLTQTAGAATPTPLPPTETATPQFTNTPEAPTDKPVIGRPMVITFTGCWTGPGESYRFISNIDPSIRNNGKQPVTILGIGSEPGWYVIQNPYFNNPCWVRAETMEIDPNMDMNQFRMMTPYP